jgi:hypothetical protein
MSASVAFPDIPRELLNDRLWPFIPFVGFISNRYSERVEGQVTAPFRSFSRGLYNQWLNDRNRPETDVQDFGL